MRSRVRFTGRTDGAGEGEGEEVEEEVEAWPVDGVDEADGVGELGAGEEEETGEGKSWCWRRVLAWAGAADSSVEWNGVEWKGGSRATLKGEGERRQLRRASLSSAMYGAASSS